MLLRVTLRRLSFLLLLSFLLTCSRFHEEKSEELSQSFYYDNISEAPFDEFRYEWMATGEVTPWQFYYGLVYWRFEGKEETGFALPYFLIREIKGKKYPHSFLLGDSAGTQLFFEQLNNEEDLSLPFESPKAVDPDEPDEQGLLTDSFVKDKVPFRGRVYILKPLVGQEPLNWAALRALYEKAKNREEFVFEWQEDPASLIEGFKEPDRIRFQFNLAENGIQDFMRTLKRRGIS